MRFSGWRLDVWHFRSDFRVEQSPGHQDNVIFVRRREVFRLPAGRDQPALRIAASDADCPVVHVDEIEARIPEDETQGLSLGEGSSDERRVGKAWVSTGRSRW